jgi:serine/threonine-protein kinase
LLHEQIGAGAFGRVYRATQKCDGREFAIKFLRKSLTTSAAALRRFLVEAKTVASLAHPGIVPGYGVGKTPGGSLFLLMDLMCGPDLERVIHTDKFAMDNALDWIAQAADTLQFAHSKGISHCDLKPSNILLDASSRARITDFGFAIRREEAASDLARLAGTPAFMAPEQVDPRWGKISPLTDIWGLGGLLLFLLFGRSPHEGRDIPITLTNVASLQPVMIPEPVASQVPGAVRDIISQCLRKAPQDRIASAQELATRLRSAATTAE